MAPEHLCSHCKTPMNCHAEKIDYAAGHEHPDRCDPTLGGVVKWIYACPVCSRTEALLET